VKRLLLAAQMRAVDAEAAAFGMSSAVLMENAGLALAEVALTLATPTGRFLVLCGLGNNGGDGLVAARKLSGLGRAVHVELCGPSSELGGEPARVMQGLQAASLSTQMIPADFAAGPGDVVIDALLGTGLNRAPEGLYADAIGRISAWRAAGAKVLSADLPSGLQSDTGVALVPCVQADVTLAFGFVKQGQAIEPGASRCGELRRVDIGIPKAAERVLSGPATWLLEEADVRARIPAQRPEAHKGTSGHVLLVAGSWGKTGAAALAGKAALRGGAGLVTVATRPEALVPVMQHAPEMMGLELINDGPLGPADLNSLLEAADGKQALVIGPGIARGLDTSRLIQALLEEVETPTVLDADALNALDGNLEVLSRAKGELMLTPHPGEFGRLMGLTPTEVNRDRVGLARKLATEQHVVVVLKGAHTVIALGDGTVFINPTGNPGMATGGTGDVLAGLCGALLAQGLSVEDAAVTAVYAHGLAGDLAAARRGQLGLIASDVIDALGDVWLRWGR
jgi:NAD(P)H-hydrate epimerase